MNGFCACRRVYGLNANFYGAVQGENGCWCYAAIVRVYPANEIVDFSWALHADLLHSGKARVVPVAVL